MNVRFTSILFRLACVFLCACSDDTISEVPSLDLSGDGRAIDTSPAPETQSDTDTIEDVQPDVVDASVDATPDVFVCKDNASCDTKNPCTQDWCNVGTGECQHTPQPDNICTDGAACTLNDICTASPSVQILTTVLVRKIPAT